MGDDPQATTFAPKGDDLQATTLQGSILRALHLQGKKQLLLYVTFAISELSAWGGTFQRRARRLAAIEPHATTTQDAAP